MAVARDPVRNVLFLCTHNSARSVLAETLLNAIGGGRFRGFSAGSFPKGQVNPLALETLQAYGHPTDYAHVVWSLWHSGREGRLIALLVPGWLHG